MTLRCVPVEPTSMQAAYGGVRVYQAMLAAAPPPPADIAEALELAERIDTFQQAPTLVAAVALARALLKSWGRE